MIRSLVLKALDRRNSLNNVSLLASRFSLLASRFSLLAFASFVFLFSFLINAQVIIKEKVEINPQTINPDYQVSSLDPCPSITRPQYYQTVYSCSGFPIEPYQQLYPFQSGTFLVFEPTTLYEVEIITGTEYAYFERVEHIDTLGNFYPYETFGNLLNGLTGAELSGTGNYIGYEGLGTFERENSSVYRIHFDNYSQAQATVTMRIKYLNTDVFTDWHTLIVNPDLRFVNQQYEADTLLHYYSKDVTPKFINANSPCAHPGYGGCPPDNVTFNIEIIEGQQYGSIKNSETNETATSFTGLSYNNLNTTFTYYANGEQPDSTATVRIRYSSNDPEIIPQEFNFTIKKNNIPPPSEGGSIYVKMDKQIVIPGDTVNVKLLWIDAVGDTVEFSQIQRFKVDLAEGSEYGTILDAETGDTSDTFTETTNEFKVIISPQIEQQQAKIVLVAEADLIIFTRPVRINNGTGTTKQLQKNSVDKVDDEGGTNTDVIIIGNHLVGVGEITITKTPFVVEIIPSVISAGDSAQIIPMKLNPDGTTTPFDTLQTFELGMLDGCALGYLSAEADSNNYFYGITQPFYFIADSSADSGSVSVRVGVIDMSQQNRSITNNNNIIPESDNPVSCANVSFVENLYSTGNLVVGDECGSGAPPCSTIVQAPQGFKEEVIEWTGTYIFNKEGFYPLSLEKASGGAIYFFQEGQIKMIPLTAPRKDKIYEIPILGSFYSPYEIETCFNKNLNNGKGAYQYSFKSIGETDNFIHKPIIIQVADYTDDPYNMKSLSDLETISFENICKALIDFEYERYRKAEQSNDNFFNTHPTIYSILDVYWEHEKYHKRDGMRFMNDKYSKALLRIAKPDGYFISKTLKKHLETTFSCSQQIKNFSDAKREGEKYIEDALRMFDNYFTKNWHAILIDIYQGEQWKQYILEELWAQWSDSVQNKISRYQTLLASRQGYDPTPCEAELNKIRKFWDPFNIYRNNR